MTTQENQTRSENSARFGDTDSARFGDTEPVDESDAGASAGDQPGRNRRKFLQGIGAVGTVSLAGCTVSFSEDGITWGDDPTPTPTPGHGPTATPEDESTATPEDESGVDEDDEIDLSEYEDGCFSGGTPTVSEGVRDGVEITVTAAGVDDRVELLRETIQIPITDYDDLKIRDDLEDITIPYYDDDEEDDDE